MTSDGPAKKPAKNPGVEPAFDRGRIMQPDGATGHGAPWPRPYVVGRRAAMACITAAWAGRRARMTGINACLSMWLQVVVA